LEALIQEIYSRKLTEEKFIDLKKDDEKVKNNP